MKIPRSLVMLNRVPHVEEALVALVDILRRMERHRYTKRSTFRTLRVSTLDEVTTARDA